MKVNSLSAKGTPDGFAVITALLQVHSREEINAVMRKINGVNGVMTVNRSKGLGHESSCHPGKPGQRHH